jgi:S1-C subfamily serine protease
MKKLFGFWFCAYFLIASLGDLEAREWTSADGTKSFKADLRSYAPPQVTVARYEDGSLLTFNESFLCSSDMDYCQRSAPDIEAIMQQSIIGTEQANGITYVAQRRFVILLVNADDNGVFGALCQELPPSSARPQHLYWKDPLYYEKLKERQAVNEMYAAVHRQEILRREASGNPCEIFYLWLPPDTIVVADRQVHQFDLYWAGTITNKTPEGTPVTIRSFCITMCDALATRRAEREGMREVEREFANKKATQEPPMQAGPPQKMGGSGTAFAITDKGHLITNAHVIEGAGRLKVNYPGGEISVKTLAIDQVNDLAILKFEGETTPLILDMGAVRGGDEILVAGFPNPELQGTSVKLTRGIISSLKGLKDDTRHFQIDAAVQPGNSGGPMLNRDGRVAGIVVARLADRAAILASGAIPQNVNYAIKLDYLTPLIKSVDGLWDLVSAQKEKPGRTAGEKATASTFLLINEVGP